MAPPDRLALVLAVAIVVALVPAACDRQPAVPAGSSSPPIPRGYYRTLQIEHDGTLVRFGPFVGYYFRPRDPGNLTHLEFVCFNRDRFYSSEMPDGALLFEGEAVFCTLEAAPDFDLPGDYRINPVYFPEAPDTWLEQRPHPQDEFLHFHSCYDDSGAVRAGFWLRHRAQSDFLMDMGGRIGPESPLHHEVHPGPVRNFARIIEFDHGPAFR